jgi:hypothetical protein
LLDEIDRVDYREMFKDEDSEEDKEESMKYLNQS